MSGVSFGFFDASFRVMRVFERGSEWLKRRRYLRCEIAKKERRDSTPPPHRPQPTPNASPKLTQAGVDAIDSEDDSTSKHNEFQPVVS